MDDVAGDSNGASKHRKAAEGTRGQDRSPIPIWQSKLYQAMI